MPTPAGNPDPNVKPPRIAITGLAGFVGGHLAAALRDAGIAVCGTVLNEAERDRAVALSTPDVAIADLMDPTALRKGFEGATHIVHLAAISSGAAGAEAWQANVDGTRNVLRAAEGRRVLLASTGYVYGRTSPERPAVESDPLDPIGDYAASKAAMERMANTEFADADVVIARSFNHTGPGQGPGFVAPAFAQQIAEIEAGKREPVLRVGNLDALREMMDVRDVVRAYMALALLPPEAGRVFNVSSGWPCTVRRILDLLLGFSTAEIRVETDPERLRPSDNPCSTGDSSRLRAATGWRPGIPLERTLEDTLNWWRARA
ncbi:MAG TPA: NAD-dependent epimerase/dehydratase family protein [Armatimonadota bacterium]